jgi:hypothetical protein
MDQFDKEDEKLRRENSAVKAHATAVQQMVSSALIFQEERKKLDKDNKTQSRAHYFEQAAKSTGASTKTLNNVYDYRLPRMKRFLEDTKFQELEKYNYLQYIEHLDGYKATLDKDTKKPLQKRKENFRTFRV